MQSKIDLEGWYISSSIKFLEVELATFQGTFFSSNGLSHFLVKLPVILEHELPDLFVLLPGLQVNKVSDWKVAIELLLRFSTRIFFEPLAIVQFVIEEDPAGNQIHLLYPEELLAFLLPLG